MYGLWPSIWALFRGHGNEHIAGIGDKACCMSDQQLFDRVKYILPALLRSVDHGGSSLSDQTLQELQVTAGQAVL